MIVEFENNYFRALLAVAPKNDVRYYLKGIHIDPDKRLATATDGHRLIRVPVIIDDKPDDVKPFILGLPKIKPVKKHRLIQAEVGRDPAHLNEITWTYSEPGDLTKYIMHLSNVLEVKYPNIDKLIPKESDFIEDGKFCFNSKYLADVPEIIGHTQVRLLSNINRFGAFKVDMRLNRVLYIVMPMKL